MQFLLTYLSANTGSFVSSPPHSEHFLLTDKQQLPTAITIVTWGGEYFCTQEQKFIRVCLLAPYPPFTGCFLPHTIFLPHTVFLWSKIWGSPFFQKLSCAGDPLCNYQCLGWLWIELLMECFGKSERFTIDWPLSKIVMSKVSAIRLSTCTQCRSYA